jgi:hypothetical protein
METSPLLEFVRLIVAGDVARVSRRLRAAPALATMALPIGATKAQASDTFFPEIRHTMYGGDTALHMAAAAYSRPLAELLVSHGADCRAKNRRGAEPLHYASDGYPFTARGLAHFPVSAFAISDAGLGVITSEPGKLCLSPWYVGFTNRNLFW